MARILVVDDDPQVLALLAEVLEDSGHIAELAKHGRQALDALREYRPALIILALRTPAPGERFLDTCRDQGLCRGVPVVILAASGTHFRLAHRPEVRAVLAKPFAMAALLGIVDRLTPGGPGLLR